MTTYIVSAKNSWFKDECLEDAVKGLLEYIRYEEVTKLNIKAFNCEPDQVTTGFFIEYPDGSKMFEHDIELDRQAIKRFIKTAKLFDQYTSESIELIWQLIEPLDL